MNDKYNPKDFEEKLYDEWETKGYFKPNMDKTKESYCIMMPPPNVTGKLHMGHALDDTMQDILIRFKRMQGYNTLWLPGTDHAAISTEMKVVQKLKAEGKTKQELGRDGFLKEAWDWTHLYGSTIQKQQRMLGCSCDWERNRFTLDDGMSAAVLEQFVKLYNDGLIYKGKRMVNWCPSCHTAISDAEVEYKEESSHLWHLRYKIKDEDKYVEVATTRPETMLGDTAVAVHPSDERYTNLVGKTCILPIVNREIPIIADEFVEKEFGTGCVKITPAHDPNDYQAGLDHNLEIIEVFDDNCIMLDLMLEVKGMKAIDARPIIVEKLKELGALVGIEDYTHNVAKCERCKSTIEPKISEQWFVSMKKITEPAIEAVKSGKVRFVPQKYEKTYLNWVENIRDWCISRQLWWGHRIPAYYCDDCNHITVAKENPDKCEKCGSTHIHQDEDTLDTWFSSALWPFSTLGWPENTEDLKTFYPTNTLVTGYDIITFWVSRMVTCGLYQMKEVPFKDVVIHGLVRDSQGRKMSKTLGNGVDPIEVINEYGADALRFSVISGTTVGNDIKYMPEKLEQASNFANKIWNAAKFIISNLAKEEDIKAFCKDVYNSETEEYNASLLRIEDKWILNKLDKLIKDVTNNINNYELGIALDNIYSFIWNEFCDWYIEMVKPRLYSDNYEEKVAVCDILNHVFGTSLKLLHPFMPFITAEIFKELVEYKNKDIMLNKWPHIRKSEFAFDNEEKTLENLKEIIVGIRNVRANMNIHPSKKAELIFVTKDYAKEIEESKDFLLKLGFGKEIKVQTDKTGISDNAISILSKGIEVYMPFEDLVDIKEEIERLEKEKTRLEAEVARGEKMLSNPGFVNKAPEAKINEEKEKLANYKKMLETVQERLNSIK